MKEAVIEPYAGGRWYERGEDGTECEWGKVLAWEPPTRLVLAWQIDSKFVYDKTLMTTVEVRFIADGPSATRVELEHRDLDRLGSEGAVLRDIVDSPRGWGVLLETYVNQVEGGHVD